MIDLREGEVSGVRRLYRSRFRSWPTRSRPPDAPSRRHFLSPWTEDRAAELAGREDGPARTAAGCRVGARGVPDGVRSGARRATAPGSDPAARPAARADPRLAAGRRLAVADPRGPRVGGVPPRLVRRMARPDRRSARARRGRAGSQGRDRPWPCSGSSSCWTGGHRGSPRSQAPVSTRSAPCRSSRSAFPGAPTSDRCASRAENGRSRASPRARHK